MSFSQAVSRGFSRYLTFGGRASRSEYWYWVLFTFIASIVLAIIDIVLPYSVLQIVFLLATLLPGLAVMIRRLHDLDRSGWWWLILLVPAVGAILLIVWLCMNGTEGPNQFGAAPA